MSIVNRHNWADVFKAGYGPQSPTTRAVLYTLNLFMDTDGKAFPSTRTVSDASGLSERSICTHIDKAVAEGWITRSVAGENGQGWKRHSYKVDIPPGEYQIQRNGKQVTLSIKGTEPHDVKALKEVQDVSGEGTEPHAEGTEPHDKKALKEVQSKSTMKSTKKSLGRKKSKTSIPEDFGISSRVSKWAKEKGYINLDNHLESFRLKCQARGYAYVDWDSAFMTAIRDDWAGLKKKASTSQPVDDTPRLAPGEYC